MKRIWSITKHVLLGLGCIALMIPFTALVLYLLLNVIVEEKVDDWVNAGVVKGDVVHFEHVEISSLYAPFSLRAEGVTVRGKNSTAINQDLMVAKEVNIAVDLSETWDNVWACVQSDSPRFDTRKLNLSIDRIWADSCAIFAEVNPEGDENFNVFRMDSTRLMQDDRRPERIAIEHVSVNRCTFEYVNHKVLDSTNRGLRNYQFDFDSVDFELTMERDTVTLSSIVANGKSKSLGFDSTKILLNTRLGLDGNLQLLKKPWEQRQAGIKGNTFVIDDLNCDMAGARFGLNGEYETNSSTTNYWIQFISNVETAQSVDFLLKFLPDSTAKLIESFNIEGDMYFDGLMQMLPDDQDPYVEISFMGEDLSFDPKVSLLTDGRVTLTDLNGEFNNGRSSSLDSARIDVCTFEGYFDEVPFRGDVLLKNIYSIDSQFVKAHFELDSVALPQLLKRWDIDTTESSGGWLDLAMNTSGFLHDVTAGNIRNIRYNGVIDMHDVRYTYQVRDTAIALEHVNERVRLENNDMVMNYTGGATGEVNGQPFALDGRVFDITTYIAEVLDESTPMPPLRSNIDLTIEELEIDLNDPLFRSADKTGSRSRQRSLTREPDFAGLLQRMDSLSHYVHMDLDLDVRHLNFTATDGEPIDLDELTSTVSLNNTGFSGYVDLDHDSAHVRSYVSVDKTGTGQNLVSAEVDFEIPDALKLMTELGQVLEVPSWDPLHLETVGHLEVDGMISDANDFRLEVRLDSTNIIDEGNEINLTNMHGNTVLVNPPENSSLDWPMVADSLYLAAKIDNVPFEIDLGMESWDNNSMELDLKFDTMEVATLHRYLRLDSTLHMELAPFSDITGTIYSQSHMTANWDTTDVMETLKSMLNQNQQGVLVVSDLNFVWLRDKKSDLFFEDVQLDLDLHGDTLDLEHVYGRLGDTELKAEGEAISLFPFLTDPDSGMTANLRVSSYYLNLTELLADVAPDSSSFSERTGAADNGWNDEIWISKVYRSNINVEGDFRSGRYRSLEGNLMRWHNLYFNVEAGDSMAYLDTMSVDLFSGSVVADLHVDAHDPNALLLGGIMVVDSVGLLELLDFFDTPEASKSISQLGSEGMGLSGYVLGTLTLEDVLLQRKKMMISDKTRAHVADLRVVNGEIRSLDSVHVFEQWKSLNWLERTGAKAGAKSFLGLTKHELLNPAPRFMLVADSLNLVNRELAFHNFQLQSNKVYTQAEGIFDFDKANTNLQLAVLRTRKDERSTGSERPYDSVIQRDYGRSSIRPEIEADNEVKYHILRTIVTSPGRIRFLFKKNVNKKPADD